MKQHLATDSTPEIRHPLLGQALARALHDRCLYTDAGWWSFELCWQLHVRQFHVPETVDKIQRAHALGAQPPGIQHCVDCALGSFDFVQTLSSCRPEARRNHGISAAVDTPGQSIDLPHQPGMKCKVPSFFQPFGTACVCPAAACREQRAGLQTAGR